MQNENPENPVILRTSPYSEFWHMQDPTEIFKSFLRSPLNYIRMFNFNLTTAVESHLASSATCFSSNYHFSSLVLLRILTGEKAPSNKTPALGKIMNVDIRVVGTCCVFNLRTFN